MNAPAIKIDKPVRDQVSREEWAVRVKLDRKDPSYAE